jgi:hypothetical protein
MVLLAVFIVLNKLPRHVLASETSRGNLLSTIKTAYIALEHLLDAFHMVCYSSQNVMEKVHKVC